MQMSPLTYWHYLLVGVLTLIFILGAILALRSDSKLSILATIIATLIGIGIAMWAVIDEKVYHVEVSQIDDHHLYQTEQLLITGVVKNTGKFPVAHVIGTIRLVNTGGGSNKKTKQFGQPTAFAELYKGDSPSYKPQNIVSKHLIADYLDPGSSKPFTIILDYPPYFTNGSYEIDGSAN
jgi:Protein of unknown function (DUF2393)